jgi:tryptophanyl-tRNA synthetase
METDHLAVKHNTKKRSDRLRILTGDRPTGPLHIGHYVGSLENRVRLQEEYDCFFIVSDYQILTDHLKDTEHTEEHIREVLLDWLAVGMDPEKSTFFIQSKIPEIAELTIYFSMMVNLARLKRNPTVKEEVKAARIEGTSYGFLGYPISQAADILIVRSNLIPVGDDQLPHVEQTREIARTFNSIFREVFPVPEALIGKIARLPGIDGKKMSKSSNNAIYLKDSAAEIRQKINMAITDPARIRATDKGNPNICNIFKYHASFNKDEVKEIKQDCRQGRTGCVACKENAALKINEFLEPIRERRAYFETRPGAIREAVKNGNERTLIESRKTINLVREAMHFSYRDLLEGDIIAAG